MTTRHFSALASATAKANAEVRRLHCPEPSLKPHADVKGAMPCLKCRGRLTYAVSSKDGRTSGKCSSVGCVTWNEI